MPILGGLERALDFRWPSGIPVWVDLPLTVASSLAPACDVALRVLERDLTLQAQKQLLASGDERLAIAAAGIIGDPTLAPWLLDAWVEAFGPLSWRGILVDERSRPTEARSG